MRCWFPLSGSLLLVWHGFFLLLQWDCLTRWGLPSVTHPISALMSSLSVYGGFDLYTWEASCFLVSRLLVSGSREQFEWLACFIIKHFLASIVRFSNLLWRSEVLRRYAFWRSVFRCWLLISTNVLSLSEVSYSDKTSKVSGFDGFTATFRARDKSLLSFFIVDKVFVFADWGLENSKLKRCMSAEMFSEVLLSWLILLEWR